MQEMALSEHLRALAMEGHPEGDTLMERAEDLDRAAIAAFEQPQTVELHGFVGALIRARRAWCDATGEPLV